MGKETPVKVIKHDATDGDGHKRETRVFARNIHETFCDYKRCKFFGKPAVQGVCFSDKPDITDWNRVDKLEKEQEDELKYFRKKYNGEAYVQWLESMYLCSSVNWRFTLDELIRLRRDNALLKLKAQRK